MADYWYDPYIAKPLSEPSASVASAPVRQSLEDYTRQAYPGRALGGGRMINLRYEACNPYVSQLMAQGRELSELKEQFYGPESTYIRWLIDNKQRSIANEIAKEQAGTRAGLTLRQPEPLPVPSWMQEYIEPSMTLERSQYPYTGIPEEEGRGGRRWEREEKPKASTLRPLGAQAELSPEQMGLMAGYQAWGMAGSPYGYSEQSVREMADWRRWFEPYTRLSESLFPQRTKLGKGWMPAKQR